MNSDITINQARGFMFTALAGVVGALVCAAILLGATSLTNSESIARTEHNAQLACKRSKAVTPYLLRYYEAHHVMPPSALDVIRATIPRDC